MSVKETQCFSARSVENQTGGLRETLRSLFDSARAEIRQILNQSFQNLILCNLGLQLFVSELGDALIRI